MPYTVIIADSRQTLEDRLNNTLVLGPLEENLPVGALTLIFANPARTVTFSGSAGDILSLADIAAEIKAAHADFNPFTIKPRNWPGGDPRMSDATKKRHFIIQADAGFTIDKDGTANTLLALPTAADLVIPAAVTATKIVDLSQGASPGHYILIIAP